MKPNDKQIAVIQMIISQALSWQYSDDIGNPTYYSDLEQSVGNLVKDGILDEDDANILLEGLEGILFSIIKDLK